MLRVLILSLLVPYVTIVVLFALAQRRLIYVPSQATSLHVADLGFAPGKAQDVTLTTTDGLTLHGWLLHADSTNEHEQAGADIDRLVLYFSGNAGHRGYRIPDLEELTQLGFRVLIFDYRGYGENEGAPSQQAMQADARAAWDFAVNDLQVDPARIVLFGESMGGAVAIHLAAELSEQGTPPAALMTSATFASLAATAQWHYPWLPCKWLLLDQWRSIDRMPRVTCPILMFHGARDAIVPLEQGRKLLTAVPLRSTSGVPRQFIELPIHGHNDMPLAVLRDRMESFASTVFDGRALAD